MITGAEAALVGSGLQFVGGKKASSSAERAAANASRGANLLAGKSAAWFDRGVKLFEDDYQKGEFNPETRIARSRQLLFDSEEKLMRNASAAANAMGFRPGDSTLLEQLKGITNRTQESMWQQDEAIRTDAFNKKYTAYRAVDPSVNNAGIQLASNAAASANQRAMLGYNAMGLGIENAIRALPQLKKKTVQTSGGGVTVSNTPPTFSEFLAKQNEQVDLNQIGW